MEVENYSNKRITTVEAYLKKIEVYNARGKCHVRNEIIQRIEGPGIQPNASSNWSNELLPIPATVPSINCCSHINLSYALTVTLNIVGAINLKVSLPITIGNVPFRGGETTKDGNSTYPASQNALSVSSAPNPPPFTDPYAPVGLTNGSFSYSPAYPPVNIGLDEHTNGGDTICSSIWFC